MGRNHRLASHIHAGSQVSASQAGMGIAPIQDRVRPARLDNAPGHRGVRSQKQTHDGRRAQAIPYEIILRMLHCNISKYVVDRRREALYQTNP